MKYENLQQALTNTVANSLGEALILDSRHFTRGEQSKQIVQAQKGLEDQGVFAWLKTCFPFAFEEEFSDDHRKYWELRWSILMRIREQRKYAIAYKHVPKRFAIKPDEFVTLLILGRGLGKSATLEASAAMRGAILGGGYCLYVCESQDQADEHVGNIRSLIENPESRLTEFYPKMEIADGETLEGIKTKDKTDIFVTIGGWICRAKGLAAKLRGIRIGTKRPDDIKIDDVDDVNDSVAVSVKKLKRLTSSVVPTQARRWATIDFGQNVIVETGCINQILTGKSDAFAERTQIGVTNTFESFEEGVDYETYLDENDGRIKHKILSSAKTTWSGVDLDAAQKFLNDTGLDTFIAEYQNSFDHQKTGKVFHEYNEERHIVPWSAFEKVFGCRYIPQNWNAAVAADLGYSKLSISAWAFVSTSPKHSPLPSHYFLYRGLTYSQQSIDDQAVDLWENLFPDISIGKRHFEAAQRFQNYPELERVLRTNPKIANLLDNYEYDPWTNEWQEKPDDPVWQDDLTKYYLQQAKKTMSSQIVSWRISHEKSGEQKTLAQKYGIPAEKTKHFGAADGATEANHLLRGDYTKPHPFFPDEKVLDENGNWTGKYRLGRPYLYFLVDDMQVKRPVDDAGLKTFREQIAGQRWTQEKLTELGLTKTIPMKLDADCGDALRMVCAEYKTAFAREPSEREKQEAKLPAKFRVDVIEEQAASGQITPEQRAMRLNSRDAVSAIQQNLAAAKQKITKRRGRG